MPKSNCGCPEKETPEIVRRVFDPKRRPERIAAPDWPKEPERIPVPAWPEPEKVEK